jgi:hypothetical protein
MRGRYGTTLLALACWTLVVSLAAGAAQRRGLGARPPTSEEQAYVEARRVDVQVVAPNALALARVREEAARAGAETALPAASRPAAVDNSMLSWFPPIGDQGYQNSCVAWAAGYYYNTYTQAADEGLSAYTGDRADVCSPAFLYPLINDGVDEGAYLDYAMARLSVIGCSSLALAPYHETDYTSWPSEAAWVEALKWRTTGLYRICTDSATGLEATRQLLANGRLAVVLIDTYESLYYDYPAAGNGISNEVLYCPGGPYVSGHALTLVGYDDAKTYVDLRDGLTHRGAFLLANSWGGSWGATNAAHRSRGFLWIAYDAFLETRRFVYDAIYTDDRDHYRPRVYALAGLSDTQRGYLELRGGAGLPSDPAATTDAVLSHSGGTGLPLSNSSRIAVDLTDVAALSADDRLADVFVSLSVASGASAQGLIASVEFRSDADSDGIYDSAPAAGLPVTVAVGATGYGFLPLYSDLTWDYWAYDEIEACSEAGIVSGYADGTYRPQQVITRDQMAVYIARALAGGDKLVPPGPTTATFPDVPPGYWAYRYVEYAAAREIVKGYSDGSYRPGLRLDRGQMAVFIARAIADPTGDDDLAAYQPPAPPTFPDVPTDFWAYRYVEYIAAPVRAITQGYADGLYTPSTCATAARWPYT